MAWFKWLIVFALGVVAIQGYTQNTASYARPGTVKGGRGRYYPALPDSVLYSSIPDFARDSAYEIAPVTSRQVCRNKSQLYLVFKPEEDREVRFESLPYNRGYALAPAPGWLKIHGNILYNLDYRSNIDTPYVEKDIYQHTIQTYLDITVKDQYPVRLYFTNRFSNSSLFRNFTNLNMQFNPHEFSNKVKLAIRRELARRLQLQDSLALTKMLLDKKTGELVTLEKWKTSPAVLQRMVMEREAAERKNKGVLPVINTDQWKDSLDALENAFRTKGLPGKPGLDELNDAVLDSIRSTRLPLSVNKTDTVKTAVKSILFALQENQAKIDSLRKQVAALEQTYRRQKSQAEASVPGTSNNAAINQITNVQELDRTLKAYHIADSSLPKGYRTLFAVKSFGIGRNMIDYSELSAKNVSVTGIQAEYNPSYYAAFATGVVDYQFRDFIIARRNAPKQYFTALRAGLGQRDGNHIILTYYTGSRQLYNSSTTVDSGATIPNSRLMGFTIEGNYKINATTSLTGEWAKSSLPYYSNRNGNSHLLSGVMAFNDRSNEAYAIKLNTIIAPTSTRLTAFYKKYGANFQSFSFFTTGTEQQAWMVKADQPFFQKRLTITGSIRENDYNNPLVPTNYKSNTVFKSIQATWRMRKWPVISVGYFPSEQLTKLSDEVYSQNLFYTLVANLSHFYKIKSVQTSTSIVYTQFYNKSADSGFVYFNTKNLMLNQTVFLQRFTLQAGASMATNSDYNLYTLENDVQYTCASWLRFGGGLKYNKQTVYNNIQMGYKTEAEITIKKIGSLQLMYDKGFIPGANKQLVSNNIGRVSYFKIF